MISLLYIIPYLMSFNSGAPVRDTNLIKNINNIGLNIEVLSKYLNNNNLEYKLNVPIYYYNIKKYNNILRAKIALIDRLRPQVENFNTSSSKKFLINLIKNNSYDIVHANTIVEATPTIDALNTISYQGKKILSLHNVDYLNYYNQIGIHKNKIERYIRKRAYKNIKNNELNVMSKYDHIIVVSEIDKKIYINSGISKEKICVIPNGVDCDLFNPSLFTSNILKRPNVLFLGKLSYHPNINAIENYIKYIQSNILKEIPNLTFYIIGKNLPKYLIDMIKDYKSIQYLGFVNDVRPYIASADICTAPLLYGSGTRLKILEYFALGKPVVSTSKGVEGLMVKNGKHLLVSDDFSVFSDKIIYLLQNEDLRKKLGNNARKFVQERHDWKTLAKKQCNLYKKYLNI